MDFVLGSGRPVGIRSPFYPMTLGSIESQLLQQKKKMAALGWGQCSPAKFIRETKQNEMIQKASTGRRCGKLTLSDFRSEQRAMAGESLSRGENE